MSSQSLGNFLTELGEAVRIIKTSGEAAWNSARARSTEFSFSTEEHKLFQRTISDFFEVATNSDFAVKRHEGYRPQRGRRRFDYELLQRSNSAAVDIILTKKSIRYISMLRDIFTENSNRIRNLQLCSNPNLLQSFLSGKHFPSLRGLVFIDSLKHRAFTRLLPILVTLDNLDTLQFTLWEDTPLDELAVIFGRLRNLHLTTHTSAATGRMFNPLHNGVKLQRLWLKQTYGICESAADSLTILPELRLLSVNDSSIIKSFRAPKLSSIGIRWDLNRNVVSEAYLASDRFDFSSIRYLYIRHCQSSSIVENGFCILGSKEQGIRCETLFETDTEILFKDAPSCTDQDVCLHLQFMSRYTFAKGLKAATSLIFPRLMNLIELHLLFSHNGTDLSKIIKELPSVEKVNIQYDCKLIDFIRYLSDASVCPRLKHLSFTTSLLPENPKEYAKEVGKMLVNCLQLRLNACRHELKNITLRNCPPLPSACLAELQKLSHGPITVVTEAKVEDVSSKSPEKDEWEEDLSDDLEM